MAEKRKETLRGNQTRVNPSGHIEPLYASNTVTLSNKKSDETPAVDDANVEYAKKFVEENKK